ncbi:MAG: MBL fold metallo-hydrolase [Acidimicrobiales bacterium]
MHDRLPPTARRHPPPPPVVDWGEAQFRLSPTVSVLLGAEGGRYPAGNAVLVEGGAESAIIDPSVTVVAAGGAPVPVDVVINSHGHEDHVAGNGLFAGARVHAHHDDLPAVHAFEGLLDVYGFPAGPARDEFATTVLEEFHYTARPDATGFGDGHVFDLGAGVTIEALHLPGHTRGHSGFVIDDVFFLSDIDLTGFGPYYGDAWSDLEQFEDSLRVARQVEARWYVTFHHRGVIEGRHTFLTLLDEFHAVIDRRHRAMLDFLAEPRSITDMAERRFVYRSDVESGFVEHVEARTASLHLARMLERGEVNEVEAGRYQRH